MCLVQPDSRYWKIVLIGRKLSLALAAILLSYDAALQAGVAASVLFMAYILQQRRSPFLVDDAARAQLELEEERGSSSTSGSGDGVVRSARGCIIMMARKLVTSLPNYNTLESTFLVASMLILLAGMVFISNGFGVGSIGYNVLTWCVASVIGGATVTFVGLVVVEVYRSIRHSKQHVADRAREADALEQAMKVRRLAPSTTGTSLSVIGNQIRRLSMALQRTAGRARRSTIFQGRRASRNPTVTGNATVTATSESRLEAVVESSTDGPARRHGQSAEGVNLKGGFTGRGSLLMSIANSDTTRMSESVGAAASLPVSSGSVDFTHRSSRVARALVEPSHTGSNSTRSSAALKLLGVASPSRRPAESDPKYASRRAGGTASTKASKY